jgi:hypothetical protein
MVKPKLIIDVAVLTHAINVRSCASHVRSTASSLLSGCGNSLVMVFMVLEVKVRSQHVIRWKFLVQKTKYQSIPADQPVKLLPQ